jgi:hypothetical protein
MKVTVDPALQAQLSGTNEAVELCDELGQTLGHFLPKGMYRDLLISWSRAVISDEEIERRMQEPRGCSLAEIWERLGNT